MIDDGRPRCQYEVSPHRRTNSKVTVHFNNLIVMIKVHCIGIGCILVGRLYGSVHPHIRLYQVRTNTTEMERKGEMGRKGEREKSAGHDDSCRRAVNDDGVRG